MFIITTQAGVLEQEAVYVGRYSTSLITAYLKRLGELLLLLLKPLLGFLQLMHRETTLAKLALKVTHFPGVGKGGGVRGGRGGVQSGEGCRVGGEECRVGRSAEWGGVQSGEECKWEEGVWYSS